MSRVEYTPLSGARAAASWNSALTDIATGTNVITPDNLLPDAFQGRILPDRPVWERLYESKEKTRNAATLASAFPVWAQLVHNGNNLAFVLVAEQVDAGEALRFSAWLSFESTLSNGVGIEGDLNLRWFRTDTSAKLACSAGRLQRLDTASAGDSGGNQHGQVYIEGWVVGPATLTGTFRVEFSYDNGAGADCFLQRSVIAVDRFYRYTT